MDIFQFLSDQTVIISAIVVVVALILQEFISDRRGSKYELTPEEATVRLYKGAKLVDLRDKESFRQCHIKGAVWHNIKQLEMYPDKSLRPKRSYIFYCSNGTQSAELATLLRNKSGYKTYFISHGFEAWQEAGLDVITN
ncbi:MAG: hypothetical protein CMF43_05750 [Legionellales bacterium]|jgi:rhodanese-related sulfurtransferase|nr:hypothetical protein [Legionellales bacterium]|tara:strand:- start:929 stop:1345 length:417 start_codon:yes stop_codon:yes gene_type:complete